MLVAAIPHRDQRGHGQVAVDERWAGGSWWPSLGDGVGHAGGKKCEFPQGAAWGRLRGAWRIRMLRCRLFRVVELPIPPERLQT